MNKLKKAYWKTTNWIEARIKKLLLKQSSGLLRHRKDKRDDVADFGAFTYKPKTETSSTWNKQIIKQRNNICVFASRKMGRWYQQGIEFSMRLPVVIARRTGWISGNGFSSLRAENKIGQKYGLVPVERCPDEENVSWNEYSRMSNEEYNQLLLYASSYKIPRYKRINSLSDALKALDKGYVLYTGYVWRNSDWKVQPPDFFYKFQGRIIGHHAVNVSGYKQFGEHFQQPNTFGKEWGDSGIAWLKSIFGRNHYDIYIEEFIPMEKRVHLFKRQNEGRMVRVPTNNPGDEKCYVIQNGKKHWVSGEDNMKTFHHLYDKQYKKLGVGLWYVKKELLDKLEEGESYPLIKS